MSQSRDLWIDVMPQSHERSPMADAMDWVAKIFTVGLEMTLFSIGGQWLGKRWDAPWLGLAGVAVGVTVGLWHLLVMTKSIGGKRGGSQQDDSQK